MILPRDRRVNGIRDSKLLTEREREKLFDRVASWCLAWGVGSASQVECDELGMSAAQRLAAQRALAQLGVVPDAAVVDGTWDFVSPHVGHVERRVKADARCLSVAAASILAKVVRDREMREQAEHYPPWSFDTNKGYPCPVHKAALQAYGPSAIHRRTWVFMDHYVPVARHPPRLPRRPAHPVLKTAVRSAGSGPAGTPAPPGGRPGGGGRRRGRRPTRIEQPWSPRAANTSSSVMSSPTNATLWAPLSCCSSPIAVALLVARASSSTTPCPGLTCTPVMSSARSAQVGGRPGTVLGVGLADVEHDPGGLDLDPRPVAGLCGGVVGEGRQAIEALLLVVLQLDRPLVAPFEAVQPEHRDLLGELEPREVVDRAPRHDGHRGDRGQLGDGVEHARQQRGLVGAGDDRRQHTVDVEADEQRPPERRRGRRHADRVVEGLGHSGLADRQVDEEALGPPLHVAAAHDLAQPGHPGPSLVAVHLDRGDDRLAQGGVVVGVDEHGVGQLVGRPGELGQHQHAVAVEAGGDVLLGDEVHAVAQRRHQHHVTGAVQRHAARRAAATGTGSGSPGGRGGRARR